MKSIGMAARIGSMLPRDEEDADGTAAAGRSGRVSPVLADDSPTEAIPAVAGSRRARLTAAARSRGGLAWSWIDAHRPRSRWLNVVLALLLLGAVVLAFLAIGNPGASSTPVRTVAVSRGTVTATVSGSGNTASSLATPVSFLTNGTVTAIDVKPGDVVTAGQILATVDPAGADATLRTAQAQLAGARAQLAQATSGPTAVKAQQDRLAITQAQQSVGDANASLATAQNQLNLDQASTNTAVADAQQKLSNDRATTGTSVQSAQAQLSSDTVAQDAAVQNACASTTTTTSSSATPAPAPPVSACRTAQNTRDATLGKDRLAVQSAQQQQNSTLSADQEGVTTAQQSRSQALAKDTASITTARQSVTSAQNSVSSAQLAAQADLHPQTPDQIAQVQATVDSAQVQVDNARLAVDETTLKAPQAGTVLAVSGKVGESSGSGSSASSTTSTSGSGSGTGGGGASSSASSATSSSSGFVTIANLSQLAVTANIAEADAAKIKLGQQATVSFPATGTTATGSVTQITPQSTVTNNVVLYPVQVSLDTAPPGVGVGATATLAITTGTSSDVLSVPTSAITTVGNRHTVTVRAADGSETVVPVQIGLSGDTTTEVTSGVAEGDALVLPTVGAPSGAGGAGVPRTGGG